MWANLQINGFIVDFESQVRKLALGLLTTHSE